MAKYRVFVGEKIGKTDLIRSTFTDFSREFRKKSEAEECFNSASVPCGKIIFLVEVTGSGLRQSRMTLAERAST